MTPLLGKKTEKYLLDSMRKGNHAFILHGSNVSQLKSLFQPLFKSEINAETITLIPDGRSISIEQIRNIKHQFSLRHNTNQPKILLISSAESMTHEAQNSFLKLLEEPPNGVIFVMLTDYKDGLLTTIQSRSTTIAVSVVSAQEANEHYNSIDESELKKAYLISGGDPGKLFTLLSDEDAEYVNAIDMAKQIIKSSTFEKLLFVEQLSKNKLQFMVVCEAIDDVLKAAINSTTINDSQIKQLTDKRSVILDAKKSLTGNANAKLVAIDALLNI